MFLQTLEAIISLLLVIILVFVPSVYSKDCNIQTDDIKIFLAGDNEAWEFTWIDNKILKQKTSFSGAYSQERTNIIQGYSDYRSRELPQHLVKPDKRFDVPFDISRNGELLIASIYDDFVVLVPSNQFALVDIKRKQIIRNLKTDYYVNSLAWAPNGNYFAVLFSQDVTKRTLKRFRFRDLFANLVGHPISYETFYVAIYDSRGVLICLERIIEKIPLGRGYIEWKEGRRKVRDGEIIRKDRGDRK